MMSDDVLMVITLIAALGSGIVSGVFFAFSAFVMKALARLPAAQGIAAMQAINVAVLNPWFLVPFMGTAVICLPLVLAPALVDGLGAPALLCLAGSGLYLAGCVLVTGVCNVPRNEALAVLDPLDDGSPSHWAGYIRDWTAWNTVRTTASLAACVAFILALVAG